MADKVSSFQLVHQQLLSDFECVETIVSDVGEASQASTSESSVPPHILFNQRRPPLSISVPPPPTSQPSSAPVAGETGTIEGSGEGHGGNSRRRFGTQIGEDRGYGWGPSRQPLKPPGLMIEQLSRCVVPKPFSISPLKQGIGRVLTHRPHPAVKGREIVRPNPLTPSSWRAVWEERDMKGIFNLPPLTPSSPLHWIAYSQLIVE
ncbi:hypothetical protein CK203_105003 [Vitis vinifera]|uniref:Uncharacterized protein n=1 Tax=Vitis vinifera TaxID=29760 RepID=A0A438CWR5_VITVI|nr:hypothetical protein CK203_105003 [Vitis vinifera]